MNLECSTITCQCYNCKILHTVLQVDSNIADDALDDTEADKVETVLDNDDSEFCKELTEYCKLVKVECNESICNCKSAASVLEDKYDRPMIDNVPSAIEICKKQTFNKNLRIFSFLTEFLKKK